ncbi:MAG: chemotaxis protein CheA [Thermoguttaceae bacterium]|jgi:two-component system chemotaxis sensor kinase CheA
MQIDMQRFHAAFFDEAAEHLTAMEEALLSLERTPEEPELLHSIFRAAHSIKGASGTFGFADIAHFTHHLESLLDRMRDGEITPTRDLVELLLHSADTLGALVAAAKDGGPLPAEVESITQSLEKSLGRGREGTPLPAAKVAVPVPVSQELAEYRVTFVPGPDLMRHGMDPLLILRDLAEVGELLEIVADTSRIPDLRDLAPEECYLGWTVRLRTGRSQEDVQAVFIFVEDSSQVVVEKLTPAPVRSEASPGEPSPAAAPVAKSVSPCQSRTRSLECSSIRVSVEKVDELINLVGELVIAQSMVNQAVSQIPPEALPAMQEALGAMSRSTRDLQERVMAVRMVPLASVFRRFPRVVHDLAGTLEKQIAVGIAGEDTELDKQMIEQIGDPLTHLVRNAVDHGIESPQERQAAGKSPEGKIGLRAYHEGGTVVIEVSDDGRGLDRERIHRKAIAQGLVKAEEPLTDEQIHTLIFAPGFSTAEQVTDVSGRGVGMDVVKRNIEALNGSVSIESQRGQGSTFRIRLPLTLAILDGLAVSLNNEIYILPLLAVVESFQPKPDDVKTINGKGEVILVRGKAVPLVRLHRIFHVPAQVTDPTKGLIVILENQGKRLGLLVDELLGQMQVVMKSLEANYQKVEGISGATILGDGHVAFILDVPGLSRLAH